MRHDVVPYGVSRQDPPKRPIKKQIRDRIPEWTYFERTLAARERPGEWFLLRHYRSYSSGGALARSIFQGKTKIPNGDWEVFHIGYFDKSSEGRGSSNTYIKYLGPAPSEVTIVRREGHVNIVESAREDSR